MKKIISLLAIALSFNVMAWEGYDYESDSHVEIERGELVREGEEIEYYDHEDGDYKQGEVNSITGSGSTVEVEVYDYDSGEYRTLEMDND